MNWAVIGPTLTLTRPAVDVALDLRELRAGKAGGDALDIGEGRPGLVDRRVHGEVVDEFHRRRSSRVSMSAGLARGTLLRSRARAASASRPARRRRRRPAAGPTRRRRAGPGCRVARRRWRRRSSPGAAATARHAAASTKGWSARPTTTACSPRPRARSMARASEVACPSAHRGLRTTVTPSGTVSSTAPVTTTASLEAGAEERLQRPLGERSTSERGLQLVALRRRRSGSRRPRRAAPHRCQVKWSSSGVCRVPGLTWAFVDCDARHRAG